MTGTSENRTSGRAGGDPGPPPDNALQLAWTVLGAWSTTLRLMVIVYPLCLLVLGTVVVLAVLFGPALAWSLGGLTALTGSAVAARGMRRRGLVRLHETGSGDIRQAVDGGQNPGC
ncbi:hypothetical protein [Amycolatopsis aidingensis]|uniref:hypothetical protein n=1 Tax=Amycolatopsis aidingensis TaxID=2842453 RepID=UPI001C0AACE4|nr:hypothetical protein [Amycolatopsis aidingensis]